MEIALLSFPSSKPPLSQTLTLKPTAPFLRPSKPNLPSFRPSPLPSIRAAISRTKKEETVETVKTELENCYLLAAVEYKGFTVKQFQDLRRSLPETSKLLVAKNTLVLKAIEGTNEEIPDAIKPYRTFQREKKVENDFTGAVFEGKFYGPGDFKQLENMPTRAEVYAKLLGSLQSPAIGLVSTLQAPARDVVMVLKAYVKKLEEESGGN
ncbi:hypothetical protein V6Z12_A05G325600 [Gossypium hirsutum]